MTGSLKLILTVIISDLNANFYHIFDVFHEVHLSQLRDYLDMKADISDFNCGSS